MNPLFHRKRSFLRGPIFSCLLLAGFSLRGAEVPSAFTINLPFGATQATPAWLGHPETPAGTFASLNLPIAPPEADASLLVTVFFTEKSGGFLRIGWQGAAGAQELTDNFYEGIGMDNQRSLLINADTMKQSGILNFQSGDSTLGIQRIELEWLETQTGLVSPAITDVLVTPANGKTTPSLALNGQAPPADSPAWRDRIVNVPVTSVPLRIEQGVDFNVELDGPPAMARLAVKEAGLPWGRHLIVWINNQRAGTISPSMPDLSDVGFSATQKTATPYVGWREGTLFVPVDTLKAGLNTLQFSTELDDPDAPPVPEDDPTPLAVKDVSFQFDYPAASSTAITTPAVTNTAPAASADVPASTPADSSPTTGPDLPTAWPKTFSTDTP